MKCFLLPVRMTQIRVWRTNPDEFIGGLEYCRIPSAKSYIFLRSCAFNAWMYIYCIEQSVDLNCSPFCVRPMYIHSGERGVGRKGIQKSKEQTTAQSIQSARLSCESSELRPPPPHPQGLLLFPPLSPRKETHCTRLQGRGGPTYDEETETLVLYVYFNPHGP